jgi:hypothetical protein
VINVRDVMNKKHQVTEIIVTFSGAVNAAEAQDLNTYQLVMAGKHGSFTAKNAKIIRLKSAVYDGAINSVALFPKKPFALTKSVRLQVDGVPPSGLQDSLGRRIDGGDTGSAGSNAVIILSNKGGASIAALALGSTGAPGTVNAATVDALLELDAFANVAQSQNLKRNRR